MGLPTSSVLTMVGPPFLCGSSRGKSTRTSVSVNQLRRRPLALADRQAFGVVELSVVDAWAWKCELKFRPTVYRQADV